MEALNLLVDDIVHDGSPVAVLENVINRIEVQIQGRRQFDVAHVAFGLPHAQTVLPNPLFVVSHLDDDLFAVDDEGRVADVDLLELLLDLAHGSTIIKEDRHECLSSGEKPARAADYG